MTEETSPGTDEADTEPGDDDGDLPGPLVPPLRRTLNVVGFVVLVAFVGLFVAVAVPEIVGADHSYVVLSDSMSPGIDAGAVVFVSEVSPETVDASDVITYRRPSSSTLVTHRVVEVVESGDQRQFRTKGDANEEPDPRLVSAGQVIGRVAFSVPLVGYAVSFAGTDLGLLTLVALPAGVLALLELRDLYADATDAAASADEDATDIPDGGEQP